MCGIIGYIGQVKEGSWAETYTIIENLLRNAEVRGTDATGFVANAVPLDSPQTATVVYDKLPLRASEFVESSGTFRRLAHRRCEAFVGHVRAATHGTPENNENNHPFLSDDETLFLVHNGVLVTHRDVADDLGLKLRTECDSELLLRIVEIAPDVASGLRDCLRLVKGSLAVAVYEKRSGCVWLAHNGGRPLWLARMAKDRRWFFASTPKILLQGIGSVIEEPQFDYFAPVPEGLPMALTVDGRLIAVERV